jgi:hypothetical protein
MRNRHDRSHFIPKGAVKYADRQSSAVVYAYSNAAGMPLLLGFHGKAQKPDFHYRYRNEEQRQAKAKAHFEAIRAREADRIQRREKRKAEGHQFKVGSILRCSWGYDQTNIDYFEVTRLIGATMIEIREIAQESYTTGWLTGRCVPMAGKFIGKPMRKIAKGDSVRIYSFAHAYLVEPEIKAGVPVYEGSSFSSYA